MSVIFQGIDEIRQSASGTLILNDSLHLKKPMRSNAKDCPNGVMDISLANFFVCNCAGAVTFSFTNVPTDSDIVSVVLQLHDGGSHALTFPSSVKWGGGAAPVFTPAGSDLVGFITIDGGTNWRGMGLNFNSGVPYVAPSAA